MNKELIIVLDFGGQYNQLIARRVRECNVYAEVHPYTMSIDEIKKMNPKGIIFTGGPNSVYKADSPSYSKEIFELGIPILGICYGSQLMAHVLGGKVATAPVSEYGRTEVTVDKNSILFKDVINDLLDESYRLYRRSTGRICINCNDSKLSICGNGKCREEFICNTVPSRGYAHRRGNEDASCICHGCM